MRLIKEQIVNVHFPFYESTFLMRIVLNIHSARFIQAVSEMEFLGFVKSTKQKTDHVARLTWGGC